MRTIACDGVLIEKGKILLIRRGHPPYKGEWAIPGGRLGEDETVEECLKREMKEETGLEVEILKLFGVYSKPERDPRKIVSIVYIVKRKDDSQVKAGGDAVEAQWFDLMQLPKLAFDHEEILTDLKTILFQKEPYRQG